ncbi:hypothetical protein Taro_033877 [Colocasia esculenta]|uniref:Uncharacterized protein n=1 Tax=Colocasia esculenta TaxID=4460 RepID=A0A843W1A8_COLES|nr:hypothetical protein [Colocasia esculenta]
MLEPRHTDPDEHKPQWLNVPPVAVAVAAILTDQLRHGHRPLCALLTCSSVPYIEREKEREVCLHRKRGTKGGDAERPPPRLFSLAMTQLEQLISQHHLPKRNSALGTDHGDREVAMFSAGHKVAEETTAHDDVIGWFDWVADNAALVQTQTLRRIVEANCGTEYLGRWLGEGLRLEDLGLGELEKLYTSLVPLSSHVEVEPYIQRIADGDTRPILTRDPITTLSLSSGTTDGRPKHIPFTRFSAQSTLQLFKLGAAHRARLFPIRAGGRILEFIYSSQQHQTRGGLKVGTATTHYYASEEFKIKQRSTKSFTCSPQEVISGGDYKQSTYCHLLLGLVHCDQVEFVTSTFAYSIVQALASLEELWQEICVDIRTGGLSHARVTSPTVRRAVLDVTAPNPGLASRIEAKCRELQAAEWKGVIPALWPSAKYVYSIMTGSMLPYLKKLRHYAGGLPLVAADYGSTESWIGVNLEPSNPPESVTFTVIPTFAYFEFIPLRSRRAPQVEQQQLDWAKEMALPPNTDDFFEDHPVPLSQMALKISRKIAELFLCLSSKTWRISAAITLPYHSSLF